MLVQSGQALSTPVETSCWSNLCELGKSDGRLVKVSKTNDITEISEDNARAYRDHLLDTVAGFTARTRINYLKGLFTVAVEEGWIQSNPFDCIKLKYIKTKPTKKEAVTLNDIDPKVYTLPQFEQFYWIMRYTGTHVGEAACVKREDIDLEAGVIHIRPHKLRPLKNSYRERDLPIIESLDTKFKSLLPKQVKQDHIFLYLYDEKRFRWGQRHRWTRHLGISPKACRDAVATILRNNDINERVLGSILGHTPENSKGLYGAVSLEAKLKKLQHLN